MKYFSILKDSLFFPKKTSMVRLNKLDVKTSILYFFLVLFLMLLPMEIKLLSQQNQLNPTLFITQVILFYPFFMVFFGLAGVLLLTGLTVVLSRLMQRKLKFQLLWKMVIFALIKPILIWSLGQWVFGPQRVLNLVVLILLAFTFYKMISAYPKARKQKRL